MTERTVGCWLIIPESAVREDGEIRASCDLLRGMLAAQAVEDGLGIDLERVAFTLHPDDDDRHALRQAEVDAYAREQGMPPWPAPRIAILLGEAPARPATPGERPGAS